MNEAHLLLLVVVSFTLVPTFTWWTFVCEFAKLSVGFANNIKQVRSPVGKSAACNVLLIIYDMIT